MCKICFITVRVAPGSRASQEDPLFMPKHGRRARNWRTKCWPAKAMALSKTMAKQGAASMVSSWEPGDDICPPWRWPHPRPWSSQFCFNTAQYGLDRWLDACVMRSNCLAELSPYGDQAMGSDGDLMRSDPVMA